MSQVKVAELSDEFYRTGNDTLNGTALTLTPDLFGTEYGPGPSEF